MQLVVNGCCIEQQKWSKIRTNVYEKVIDLVEFPYIKSSTGEIIFAFSNSTFGGVQGTLDEVEKLFIEYQIQWLLLFSNLANREMDYG